MREPYKPFDAEARWRMCGSKVAYPTQSAANKASHKLPYDTNTYECPICACWHLTTRKRRTA